MAEYPDNSHSARESQAQQTVANGIQSVEKRFEKVVSGTAKIKKKSIFRQTVDLFLPADMALVKDHIVNEVVVPGVKKVIAGVCSEILGFPITNLDRISVLSDRKNYQTVSYNTISTNNSSTVKYSKPTYGFNYEDVIFETRGDAEFVLDQLEAAIEQFHVVSVGDLLDLAGISSNNYAMKNKYGWTDLRSAKVVMVSDGYALQMPRAIQI